MLLPSPPPPRPEEEDMRAHRVALDAPPLLLLLPPPQQQQQQRPPPLTCCLAHLVTLDSVQPRRALRQRPSSSSSVRSIVQVQDIQHLAPNQFEITLNDTETQVKAILSSRLRDQVGTGFDQIWRASVVEILEHTFADFMDRRRLVVCKVHLLGQAALVPTVLSPLVVPTTAVAVRPAPTTAVAPSPNFILSLSSPILGNRLLNNIHLHPSLQPVVQIVSIEPEAERTHQIYVSDGNLKQRAILSAIFGDLVRRQELQVGSLIRISEMTFHHSRGALTLRITDMHILATLLPLPRREPPEFAFVPYRHQEELAYVYADDADLPGEQDPSLACPEALFMLAHNRDCLFHLTSFLSPMETLMLCWTCKTFFDYKTLVARHWINRVNITLAFFGASCRQLYRVWNEFESPVASGILLQTLLGLNPLHDPPPPRVLAVRVDRDHSFLRLRTNIRAHMRETFEDESDDCLGSGFAFKKAMGKCELLLMLSLKWGCDLSVTAAKAHQKGKPSPRSALYRRDLVWDDDLLRDALRSASVLCTSKLWRSLLI